MPNLWCQAQQIVLHTTVWLTLPKKGPKNNHLDFRVAQIAVCAKRQFASTIEPDLRWFKLSRIVGVPVGKEKPRRSEVAS